MPIFQSLNLECMLIYQHFFFEKLLFTTQVSTYVFDAKVAEKFLNGIYLLSNCRLFSDFIQNTYKSGSLPVLILLDKLDYLKQ